jgi:hypothetical protein
LITLLDFAHSISPKSLEGEGKSDRRARSNPALTHRG